MCVCVCAYNPLTLLLSHTLVLHAGQSLIGLDGERVCAILAEATGARGSPSPLSPSDTASLSTSAAGTQGQGTERSRSFFRLPWGRKNTPSDPDTVSVDARSVISAATISGTLQITLEVLPQPAVSTFTLFREDPSISYGIFLDEGLIVAVGPDSPAARAGVQCGHVLLQAGPHRVVGCSALRLVDIFRMCPDSVTVTTMPAPIYDCLTAPKDDNVV